MIVTERAPLRLSFVTGGDADYYISRLGWGNALNATISLYASSSIRPGEERQPEQNALLQAVNGYYRKHYRHLINGASYALSVTDGAPRESGLGGSSAHCVAAIRALNAFLGISQSPADTARLAYEIERVQLGIDGGYQDQYAAAFGGFNYMVFQNNGTVTVEKVAIPTETKKRIEEMGILIHIPREVRSSVVNKNLRVHAGDPQVLESIARKRALCLEAKHALETGNIDAFITIVDVDYHMKRAKSPLTVNPAMEKIYAKAMAAGCLGGKFMGTGSGGCALFFAGDRENASEALSQYATIMDFAFER